MDFSKLEIIDLKIEPFSPDYQLRSFNGRCKTRAICTVTFGGGLVIRGVYIKESRQNGVYVKWPLLVDWASADGRKSACNRILATWVINYCCDDQTAKEEK